MEKQKIINEVREKVCNKREKKVCCAQTDSPLDSNSVDKGEGKGGTILLLWLQFLFSWVAGWVAGSQIICWILQLVGVLKIQLNIFS